MTEILAGCLLSRQNRYSMVHATSARFPRLIQHPVGTVDKSTKVKSTSCDEFPIELVDTVTWIHLLMSDWRLLLWGLGRCRCVLSLLHLRHDTRRASRDSRTGGRRPRHGRDPFIWQKWFDRATTFQRMFFSLRSQAWARSGSWRMLAWSGAEPW